MTTTEPRDLRRASQCEVLDAVFEQLPEQHPHMALDRAWVWYCGPSLQPDECKPIREKLAKIGFRFAPKGHAMSNGLIGSWAHHGLRPLPNRFSRGKGGKRPVSDLIAIGKGKNSQPQPESDNDLDAEIMAALE